MRLAGGRVGKITLLGEDLLRYDYRTWVLTVTSTRYAQVMINYMYTLTTYYTAIGRNPILYIHQYQTQVITILVNCVTLA